jgi:hypothetical protein
MPKSSMLKIVRQRYSEGGHGTLLSNAAVRSVKS